jgi:hypothetical protein
MCTKQCSTVGGCPFSFTDESEQIQNYGCLPTPLEIVHMRQAHGKTWACHSDNTKPCLGALKFQRSLGVDSTVVDSNLVTEDSNWGLINGGTEDTIPLSITLDKYHKAQYNSVL